MLESLANPDTWAALLALTSLEIVLGIDNIVFIAILSDRLPKAQQGLAYRLGLAAALITRLLLLFTISWVMGLTEPLFTILSHPLSGRDLILLCGGLFLIGKASHEIFDKVEGHEEEHGSTGSPTGASLAGTVVQIMLLDIVFSLDSVITAVGMAEELWIMVVAMVTAVGIMLVSAQAIGNFVNRHPSMKILALSFLMLVGVLLTAEGMGQHIEKGYIYFAMSFSFIVELINMKVRGSSPAKVAALEEQDLEHPDNADGSAQ